MTFAQLYRQCRRTLTDETADFDLSELFKAHFSGSPGLRFSESEVPEDEAFVFRQKVKKMSGGYPLQYLLGEWEFYGLPFKVGPGVLIPQPDTETLVDVTLELTAVMDEPLVADYCAGSGAISVAVAKHRPSARVWAVELSDDAIDYLNDNIALNGCGDRITVIKGDVRGELDLPELDVIVSNPPYVTADEMKELPPQVMCEPEMALFGGEDGLDFYKAISERALSNLKSGGWLVFEAGWRQAGQVSDILRQNGYTNVSVRRDLCGVERCIYAQKPKTE